MNKAIDKASKFAIDHGFDGAVPYGNTKNEFMASFYDPYAVNVSKWYPMFDNTPHIIVVDETGARWRSEEDAISVNIH